MPTHLHVWSFEERLTNKDKEDLLKHFGADSVQHIPRHGKDKAVLARFAREEDCEYAMTKLHQQKLLGKRLMAVYKDITSAPISKQPHLKSNEDSGDDKPDHAKILKDKMREFEAQLSAISAHFGIKHPIPPHLKYLYPPPSPSIIANIAHALIAIPKFYNQVLHLMNKMNLPTPFGRLKELPQQYKEILKFMDLYTEKEPLQTDVSQSQKTQDDLGDEAQSKLDSEASETESELESDKEDTIGKPQVPKPVKRRKKPGRIANKRPNFSLLKQTCIAHPRVSVPSVEEAFEPLDKKTKRLEVKLKGTLPSTTERSIVEEPVPGGFGIIEAPKEPPSQEPDNPVEWQGESTKFISKEELQNNKVSKADWAILPVFKNYQEGDPTTKLYIKNLAKTSTEADLKHIYGNYVFWHNEEEASLFTIRLMKEGRMKGQAFVTFPSVENAKEALNDTNGYILNDKPMVVCFGKVKATGESTSKT